MVISSAVAPQYATLRAGLSSGDGQTTLRRKSPMLAATFGCSMIFLPAACRLEAYSFVLWVMQEWVLDALCYSLLP
jgi:hypothetical protein